MSGILTPDASVPGPAGPGTPGAPTTTAGRPARGRSLWWDYALRRGGGLLLSITLLVLVTFFIVPLIPGDPASPSRARTPPPSRSRRSGCGWV